MVKIPDRPLSVLVVEDTPDLLDALRLVLRAAGLAVLTAESGAKAIDVLNSIRSGIIAPDVIITDIRMPDINGLSLIQYIRNHPDLAQIGILAITGEDQVALDHAKEFGADAVLQKPVDPDEMLAIVKKLAEPRPPD
jgi:CheY-like chemotaxis protein